MGTVHRKKGNSSIFFSMPFAGSREALVDSCEKKLSLALISGSGESKSVYIY